MILNISSAVSYVIALLIPALDVLIPVLPSESVVITLGAMTAGSADPRITLLVTLAALGAFLGDNATYLLGRRFGPTLERRLFGGERGAWARRSLDRFGVRLIIVCRFIPGGRTAVMLTCGVIGYPARKFRVATAVAGIVWACYAFFLGRLGGKLYEDRPWMGLLIALGLGLAVSVLIEAARRAWRWYRARRRSPHPLSSLSPPRPASLPGPARNLVDAAPTRKETNARNLSRHRVYQDK